MFLPAGKPNVNALLVSGISKGIISLTKRWESVATVFNWLFAITMRNSCLARRDSAVETAIDVCICLNNGTGNVPSHASFFYFWKLW